MSRDHLTDSLIVRPQRSRPSQERFIELERVTLLVTVQGDDGEMIPAGASGTVVAVWSGGSSYDVDFAKPVSALATVPATAIERGWAEGR